MSARTSLLCDACGIPYREGSLVTAGTLRLEAGGDGWHRQPGGTDVCPECWAKRRRFRLVSRELDGRTIRTPRMWEVPTGWGNGRFRS